MCQRLCDCFFPASRNAQPAAQPGAQPAAAQPGAQPDGQPAAQPGTQTGTPNAGALNPTTNVSVAPGAVALITETINVAPPNQTATTSQNSQAQ